MFYFSPYWDENFFYGCIFCWILLMNTLKAIIKNSLKKILTQFYENIKSHQKFLFLFLFFHIQYLKIFLKLMSLEYLLIFSFSFLFSIIIVSRSSEHNRRRIMVVLRSIMMMIVCLCLSQVVSLLYGPHESLLDNFFFFWLRQFSWL